MAALAGSYGAVPQAANAASGARLQDARNRRRVAVGSKLAFQSEPVSIAPSTIDGGSDMIERGLRFGLLAVAVLSAVLGAGYYLQLPWAVQTWPWPETRLSNIFIASILAAVAGAMLWVGASGRLAGAAGG